MDHSKLVSPSSSSMWLFCAGSSHAQLHMPDLFSHPAEEGTAVHMMAEACFRFDCDTGRFLGKEFNNITMTESMCDDVQEFLNLCRGYEGKRYVEYKLSMPSISDELFGTLDFAVAAAKVLYLFDLKYGFENVTVDANGQLWIYALMLLQELPEVETIVLGIFQPRVRSHNKLETKTVSALQIKQWSQEVLKPAVKAALDSTSPRTPGGHCKHCKAKITCPEYLSWCNYHIEPPFNLSSETIATVLKWAPTVKKLIAQAESYGNDWLQRGIKIPGCKLVKKVKHRKIKDERTLASDLLDAGVSENLIFNRKIKTPAQLEKSIDKQLLEGHFYTPEGEKTIALLEDSRPAVATSKDIFKNVKV